MQLFSIQQRIFAKCQQRQAHCPTTKETENAESKSKSRRSNCLQILASIKKALRHNKTKEPVSLPSMISPSSSSSSSISYESCLSEPTEDELNLRSYRLSPKTMVLDALIFDHPSLTVCIRPASYRST
ncbi:hypothetical protein J3Q64DRAFT_1835916 [Phycomyces blakesleeanus]|uniref:Uncharacterized protein n=2 Tax=Phycomyces blakesleeanus TaxID=4837 RepID=A0A162U5I6_PHYB8|nr:hypothetical protein PHYBLDRAFT_146675 [Phycomyces blakesleeanus NRRL 1555(-)]OAD72483.1 hypothetical protein PHYBLDRAFT_146675 [Phycomyces blakesleeanus NRRL 1555(-)]|eukprot:XP_018290523.1 hypothetical protein PHYBLDRAFT_146675 [Phycomyces blakesleeanus NRRL 1555(-)]